MLIDKIKLFIIPLFILFIFFSVPVFGAEGIGEAGLDITAKKAGIPVGDQEAPKPDIPTVIGSIIGVVLSLLGSLFLFLIVYGGFMWMTAGGNESQVTKAKTILTSSVIGLIIIVFSYALVSIVFSGGEQAFQTTP